ncbi:hypothetical protein FAES_3232 [Fibrella aestuarina BUZ 2]|uniref:Uncharacterized protein n=1 Tax=Fibrella aestuarina BUZ 2 TaxID=1166018 RepID=I0KAT8_9BACT|nr:hypothetical protein [Fibrella aestuarina]CCH01241.1 hypothetical protein FAES_3232 [Fibrella aestuarina BUZ 2]
MNLKGFFAQDNAIAKLTGWLVLIPALITLAVEHFNLPESIVFGLSVLSLIAAVSTQTLQNNSVYSISVWIAAGFTVLLALAEMDYVKVHYPQLASVLAFLGSAYKLYSPFTVQKIGDAKPAVASDPQLPPVPTKETR